MVIWPRVRALCSPASRSTIASSSVTQAPQPHRTARLMNGSPPDQSPILSGHPDWAAFRALFPTLGHKAYLASGSYGLLAKPVEAALRLYLNDRLEKGVDWDGWGERQEAVREAVAGLLNADANETGVTTSASAGINSLVSALEFSGPRNKVLVSNLEFPTGAQIWYAQASRGAVVEHAPEAPTGPCRWSTSTG
jgi:selenocysteine lyase/cysteine desulfurase